MSNFEKEAMGSVKARFLNRVIFNLIQNADELDYMLEEMSSENEAQRKQTERGLVNSFDNSERNKKLAIQEM